MFKSLGARYRGLIQEPSYSTDPNIRYIQSINAQDDDGNTILYLAVKDNDHKLFDQITHTPGSKVFLTKETISPAFLLSITKCDVDKFRILVKFPIDINYISPDKKFPLMEAIETNNLEMVETILRFKNLDINMIGLGNGNPEMLKEYNELKKKVENTNVWLDSDIYKYEELKKNREKIKNTFYHMTPIMRAVLGNNKKIISLLLNDSRLDINKVSHRDLGMNAVFYSLRADYIKIERFVIHVNTVREIMELKNIDKSIINEVIRWGSFHSGYRDTFEISKIKQVMLIKDIDQSIIDEMFTDAVVESNALYNIKQMITLKNIDLTMVDVFGNNPMLMAIIYGQYHIAEILVDKLLDDYNVNYPILSNRSFDSNENKTKLIKLSNVLNAKNKNGENILILLIKNSANNTNCSNTLEKLLNFPYIMEMINIQILSEALIWAIHANDKMAFDILITFPAQVINVNWVMNETRPELYAKQTFPLFEAVRLHRVEMVEMLLMRRDIDPNIIITMPEQNLSMVLYKEIEKKNKKSWFAKREVGILKEEASKISPLGMAIKLDDKAIVKLLVNDTRIEINQIISGFTKYTALLIAADNDSPEVVKILLQHPDIDVLARDYCGNTAQMIAHKNGYKNVVKVITDHLLGEVVDRQMEYDVDLDTIDEVKIDDSVDLDYTFVPDNGIELVSSKKTN